MKKLENFARCLEILQTADKEVAMKDEIYRMGVIGQFNLTFELAWKALKEMLTEYGVDAAKTGSPREVLREGYSSGFLNDADIWLDMMKRRNTAVHAYDLETAVELLDLIFETYTPAFNRLLDILLAKSSKLPTFD